MGDKEIFEKVYEKPGAIWTNTEPPKELIELIKTNKIKPCKVLDIGCGEGKYSIYLAEKGFEVTGIDISEKAIGYAKENAEKRGVKIKFIAMDIADLSKLNEKFDFVFEWAVLHCVPFEERKTYIESISNLLNKNGKYFSVCFNVNDIKFGNVGERIRIVPENARAIIGAKMFFSSLEELKELFSPNFKIIESKVFEEMGAGNINTWNYFFMEKA